MKLVLDEHYSPVIAEELRRRGYDVVPVAERVSVERASLRQALDEDLLRWARVEGRVIVTEDVGDFMALHRAFLARGELHAGILFTSPHKYPRHRGAIGVLVAALAEFIDGHGESTLEGDVAWL